MRTVTFRDTNKLKRRAFIGITTPTSLVLHHSSNSLQSMLFLSIYFHELNFESLPHYISELPSKLNASYLTYQFT